MNASLVILEIAVLVLGLGLLLLDLWTPPAQKRSLGYGAATALGVILIYSFFTLDGGIALVYGGSGTMNFGELAKKSGLLVGQLVFLLGLLLVLMGLAFKIAAFPLQIWTPDVYQGSPAPTTAFLAVGSKAAGFVLLLRVLFYAVPQITARWAGPLIVISAVTILYGNLC